MKWLNEGIHCHHIATFLFSNFTVLCRDHFTGKPTIARLPYVQIYINTQHTLSTHNRRPWRLFISGIFAIFVLETRGTYRMWSSVNSFLFSLHILDKSVHFWCSSFFTYDSIPYNVKHLAFLTSIFHKLILSVHVYNPFSDN